MCFPLRQLLSNFANLFLQIVGEFIIIILCQMNKDLLHKYQNDENFQKEIKDKDQRYKSLEQAGNYCDLQMIPNDILRKIPNHNIYVYIGCQQPTQQKLLQKIAIFLVKNFHPETEKPYTFIFLNQFCPDNYVLWNFRGIFSVLTFQQIACLQEMIVVKPYFYHKAMDWMTFGTIPRYIKSKTVFVHNLSQLCQKLSIDPSVITSEIPSRFYEKEFPDLINKNMPITSYRQNLSGQQRCEQDIMQMETFQKTIQSMIRKPGTQMSCLSDYEMSEIGIPTILKMLIFYFETNPQGVKLQGLFRKSVSIDEQKQTLNQIMKENYDYLLKVQNPHIIANLIKRFFSSLKIPIFPFELYDYLMEGSKQKTPLQLLKIATKELPELNQRVLLVLINFFNDQIIVNENQNKMGAQNLGICFGPCLFRAKQITNAQIFHAAKAPMFTKLLITKTEQIFGDQSQRTELYRKSYVDLQKSFQNQIDLGLGQAMNDLQNLQKQRTPRCSMLVAENNVEQLPIIIQNQPEPKFEQKQQQIDFLTVQASTATTNPRFSRAVPQSFDIPNIHQQKRKQEQQPEKQNSGIVSVASSNYNQQDENQLSEQKLNSDEFHIADHQNSGQEQIEKVQNPKLCKQTNNQNEQEVMEVNQQIPKQED